LSTFYGYSVIELHFDKNGLVQKAHLFPRENCLPNYDSLLPDVYGETLVSITGNPNYLRVYQNDLGLLLKATPFTILKRHAKAFWSRFQELFGIPFRHAKYTGNDSRVIDTLYQNLKEMGSAAFGVFPAGAEIGFLENSKSDAYSVFLEAIKQANEEISQLVLGTPASQNDMGSFARDKVSYEKEGDISYADLRFVQFVINDELFPLLNQWGYNFEGLQFIFEPSWKLPLAGTQLEVDRWIAEKYEISEEYITETYGVPVKKKSVAEQNSVALVRLEDIHAYLYATQAHSIIALNFNTDWAKDDYKPLFDYYANEFTKAINKGWQQDLDNAIFIKLHQNAYEFAGVKYLTLKKQIAAGETDKEVFERHERYLDIEKQHFTASSQMASKWQVFEKNKDKLPYLQWVTAQDEAVRESHAKLNGIIKPVDDTWWDNHPVPLGYGCRCTIRQLSKATAEKDPNFGKEAPEVEADKPLFKNNAGKTGVAFNNKHPYFDNFEDFKKQNAKDLKTAKKNLANFSFTRQEIDAIKGWSDTDYILLDKYYKKTIKDKEVLEIAKERANLIEAILEMSPKYYGVSYRGENTDEGNFVKLSKLKSGDVFSFEKIHASTIIKAIAEEFASGDKKYQALFEIANKKGVFIADISTKPFELEVLNKPNASYVVLSVEIKNNKIIIKLLEK
jgi:SPP1 gp7 family putative phage head morphogenesis protein